MSSQRRTHPRRRALLWVVGGLVVALLAGGVFVAVTLRSNITVVDVNDALSAPSPVTVPAARAGQTASPPEPTQPVNILVMGSDTRQGQGDGFGSAELIEGARSDTTLLVHLSADREDVTVVSIPRDLVVDVPSCTLPDGTTSPAYTDRFNSAFEVGGPECTIRTVTELTGLPVQHFVVVDFTAFEKTVDALGGVEVCLTRAVDDPLSGLDLPAGISRVDGEQGLAFVRARSSLGDGSDLARIERQQAFLGSLVREATSRELLTDPIRLYRTLDAATESLSMDSGLAWLPQSAAMARSLAGISPSQVSFVTYPYLYNDDFLTVRPDEAKAMLLVEVLAADADWPFPPSKKVDLAPAGVSVTVVNATGRDDQATIVGSALATQGFGVAGLTTAPEQTPTQVRYPTWAQGAATTVAAAVDGATLVPDDSLGGVTLVLGTDWGVGDLRTVAVKRAPGDTATPAPSDDASPWQQPDGTGTGGGTSTADTATCAS